MKLWLLKARENLPEDDNPWSPPYDKAQGFVVRAQNPTRARSLAQQEAGDEKLTPKYPWIDSRYSTCRLLTSEGSEKVILRDFQAG